MVRWTIKEITFLLALCRRSPLGEAKSGTKTFKYMLISTERVCLTSQCACSQLLLKDFPSVGLALKGQIQVVSTVSARNTEAARLIFTLSSRASGKFGLWQLFYISLKYFYYVKVCIM